jgi:DNA-directed RNA polymerase specialized sigma subunit
MLSSTATIRPMSSAKDKLLANRRKRASHAAAIETLDAEQTQLVKEALAEGDTAAELAEILGVSRARVYQIRDGRR